MAGDGAARRAIFRAFHRNHQRFGMGARDACGGELEPDAIIKVVPLRLWLWPNLLSLDAPLVAVLWQQLFARCFGLPGDAIPALLLVASVWLIYAADRAFDVWRGEGD